jgi:hypothetical protein
LEEWFEKLKLILVGIETRRINMLANVKKRSNKSREEAIAPSRTREERRKSSGVAFETRTGVSSGCSGSA